MMTRHISFYAGHYCLGARAFTMFDRLEPTCTFGGIIFHLANVDGWTVYQCAELELGEMIRLQREFDELEKG